MRLRPFLVLVLGCAGAFGLGAQPASAGEIYHRDGGHTLEIRTWPDPVNSMQIGLIPGNPADYRITDSSANIGVTQSIYPCQRDTLSSVRCPSAPVTSIRVLLSTGGDSFSVPPDGIPANVKLSVWGDEGPDQITGRSGAGRELLSGEEDDDNITALCPAENKVLKGGSGNDTLTACSKTLSNSLFPRMAPALAAASLGATLIGEGGNDTLVAGPANDSLRGGPGNDRAYGGPGKDIIDCGPGKHDLGVGGPGRDLGKNCERVRH
jgi:Ca2+-binding RTX toxin-like protein